MQLQTTFIYVTHDQIEAMTMASRIAVINKGVLQQVDTPQHLYDQPNNLFVAGFIGSPSMNFFDGKLVRGDGKLYFDGNAVKVEIPADRTNIYLPYEGKPVKLGLRPENIYDPQFLPPEIYAQPVDGNVEVTELMGNEIQLYINSGEHKYVARVDPRSHIKMGKDAQVVFNMNTMHLFDPATDQAIR
jgi:multiple sugar transport system ATP-binding protein